MKYRVTGIKQIRPDYRQIYFRSISGKSYITHIETSNGNASRWLNLKKGDVLDSLLVLRGNIINADSLFQVLL